MRSRHEENEASVLHFSREKLGDGVHLATIKVRKGENSLFHKHTVTRDTFYVVSGRLTVTLHLSSREHAGCYAWIGAVAREVITTAEHTRHRVTLSPGAVLVVEPNVIHCAANLHDEPCHLLCLEGVGEYDFIECSA